MPPTEISRGFFTIAQNTNSVDYVRLAYGLALSLKYSQSNISRLSIGITPGTQVEDRYKWAFDEIVEIPWSDDAEQSPWKLQNEWKSIWMTPYEETIKLDSDMLFLSDIDAVWQQLGQRQQSVSFANTVLDWRSNPITDDYYRKVFTANRLPNIYTAFTYFRKMPEAYEFFNLAKMITWNWEMFFENFLEPITRPTHFSTDVAFALAMKILDLDQTNTATNATPTFVHMKSQLQGWNIDNISEDWRKHIKPFFNTCANLKIGNHVQFYPLHYHVKDFLTDAMLKTYEGLLA